MVKYSSVSVNTLVHYLWGKILCKYSKTSVFDSFDSSSLHGWSSISLILSSHIQWKLWSFVSLKYKIRIFYFSNQGPFRIHQNYMYMIERKTILRYAAWWEINVTWTTTETVYWNSEQNTNMNTKLNGCTNKFFCRFWKGIKAPDKR